jgi:thioredoxin-dependent peroxiredoxin
MARTVTFKGSPLTLVGRALIKGTQASDFTVVSQDLQEVSLSRFKGKVKIITTFPSIDTPVCDLQVKEFNKRATQLGADVVVVGISKDLPFAQKRFCETFDIEQVTVLSDYKTGSFGINYGLLIKELNLLARAVLIVDKNDVLGYIQIVPELTLSPDYEDVLRAVQEILKNSAGHAAAAASLKCVPCEGAVSPLPKEKIEKLLAQHRGWQLVEDKKLTREFKFKDFAEAKYFLDILCVIAQEQGHHPTLTLIFNKLKVTLSTHAAGGLTDNDFIMARLIDEINDVSR